MTEVLPKLSAFVLPGGSVDNILIHEARCQARKVETLLPDESDEEMVHVRQYINRLSDFFFTLARYHSYVNKTEETPYSFNKSGDVIPSVVEIPKLQVMEDSDFFQSLYEFLSNFFR
jgi:cob(I)alamin adenosyltransferase